MARKIASKQERLNRIKKGVKAAKKGTFSLKTKEMANKAKGGTKGSASKDRMLYEKAGGVKRGSKKKK